MMRQTTRWTTPATTYTLSLRAKQNKIELEHYIHQASQTDYIHQAPKQSSMRTSHTTVNPQPHGVRTPRAVRRRLVHTREIPPARGDTHITWPMLHGIRGHLPSIRSELVRLGRGALTLIHKLPEIPIIEMEAPTRQALRPATILHPEVKVHTGIRRGELSLRLGYVATRPTLPRE